MAKTIVSRRAEGVGVGGGRLPLAALAVLLAFGFSGAAGLMHEVAWTRLLRLVMGNTTFSITTVLCVFMAGLALGSYVGGRLIDRRGDCLRVFAVLEAVVGLYCGMLPWLINVAEPIYRWLYQNTSTSFYVLSLVRFAFCSLLLLVPATAMGATLPVLSRFFAGLSHRVGWSVGIVYAINTFGAVVGAGATGFVLIPSLGVTRTIFLACVLNLSVAATAYGVHRRKGLAWQGAKASGGEAADRSRQDKRKASAVAAAPRAGVGAYGPGALWVLLAGYGLSGFSALAYEITWTRALAMMLGSSVYAFSMILTAFILGLAIGSAVFARFTDRLRDPMRAMAILEVAIGLSALTVVPFIGDLPQRVMRLISGSGQSFWQVHLLEFGMILLITLAPTVLMGAAFPLASRIFAEGRSAIGRSVGTVYSCNTLGAILGSFFGGFVLIPWLGIERTIFVTVWANLLVGCGFLLVSRSMRPSLRGVAASVVLAGSGLAMAMVPPWDPAMMTSGPFLMARRVSPERIRRDELRDIVHRDKLVFYKEGLGVTVAVRDQGDTRTLVVNGKPDASNRGDLSTQLMLAHVPLLLHEDPHDVLVVGLGSGITLGSAAIYPVRSLDCVEISQPVVEASHFFDEDNRRPLEDKRVRLIVSDGRNHISLTGRQYDVIISEPSNPWIAGIADLFTLEYFQHCRERLRPRGILCCWVNMYDMKPQAFRSILQSFRAAFPDMWVWQSNPADCLLIGSKGPLTVDWRGLTERMARTPVAEDLKRIGVTSPENFLGHVVMGASAAGQLAGDAPRNTDDNALLEFAMPALSYKESMAEGSSLQTLIDRRRQADLSMLTFSPQDRGEMEQTRERAVALIGARGHLNRSQMLSGEGKLEEAWKELELAARLCSGDPTFKDLIDMYLGEAKTLATAGKVPSAIVLFQKLLGVAPDDPEVSYEFGNLLSQHERLAEAAAQFRRALSARPDWAQPMVRLSRILLSARDPNLRNVEEGLRLAQRACELTGQKDAGALSTLAIAYTVSNHIPEALEAANQAMALARTGGDEVQIREIQKIIDFCRTRRLRDLTSAPAG